MDIPLNTSAQPTRKESRQKSKQAQPEALNVSNFSYGRCYLICMFSYIAYLRGERNVWTDTFPPQFEGAD